MTTVETPAELVRVPAEVKRERILGVVYLILAALVAFFFAMGSEGDATFRLGEEELDAPAGTVVHLRDPDLRRHAVAAEDGTAVLAIGGKPGEAYTPSAWEATFAAERHRPSGDFAAMADELAGALAEYPDNGGVLYNLACAEAQAGRLDDALAHLRRALELRPELAEWSQQDEDLAALRGRGDSWA